MQTELDAQRLKADKEKANNIKMLKQLKRAHETIEEMKALLEKAQRKVSHQQGELDLLRGTQAADERRFQEVFGRQEQQLLEQEAMIERLRCSVLELKRDSERSHSTLGGGKKVRFDSQVDEIDSYPSRESR